MPRKLEDLFEKQQSLEALTLLCREEVANIKTRVDKLHYFKIKTVGALITVQAVFILIYHWLLTANH